LEAQVQELQIAAFTLKLDGLYGIRADINADHACLSTFEHHA
jgi:hypothetical protein